MFFVPTVEFVESLKQYAGRRVVLEVGTGDGHLLKAMLDAGMEAYGCDAFKLPDQLTDAQFGRWFPSKAEDWALLKDMAALVVVARPCHGGFVRSVIEAMSPESELLYIGLERNVQADLGEYEELASTVGLPLEGTDAEVALSRKTYWPEDDEMEEYFLVQYPPPQNARAWMKKIVRRGEDWFVNSVGGGMPVSRSMVVVETCKVADYADLDFTKTSAYAEFMALQNDESVKEGWIERSGTFYRCQYHEHDAFAWTVFKKTPRELEKLGWVKVTRLFGSKKLTYLYDYPFGLSPEQVRKLTKLGIEVDEGDVGGR